jgi:hypothetical protein
MVPISKILIFIPRICNIQRKIPGINEIENKILNVLNIFKISVVEYRIMIVITIVIEIVPNRLISCILYTKERMAIKNINNNLFTSIFLFIKYRRKKIILMRKNIAKIPVLKLQMKYG